MLYGNHVSDTRQVFFVSWKKYRQNQPLQALEKQLVEIILAHPEYHSLLESDGLASEQAYFPELGQTNPFLHMGLHLTLREQVATNRPEGITAIYQQLLTKYTNQLAVEHIMIEPLAECLWQSQRNNTAPNESAYLHACRQLVTSLS